MMVNFDSTMYLNYKSVRRKKLRDVRTRVKNSNIFRWAFIV